MDPETKDLANYTADKPLGESWTDKVLALKESEGESVQETLPKEQGDCAEDDEWVSFLPSITVQCRILNAVFL